MTLRLSHYPTCCRMLLHAVTWADLLFAIIDSLKSKFGMSSIQNEREREREMREKREKECERGSEREREERKLVPF